MSGKSLLIVLGIFLLLANGLLLVYMGVIKLGAGARSQEACELRGIITDEKGAFIAGATLTLSGDGHGYSTETDNQGRFRFIGLKSGAYALTVMAKGFAKQQQAVELTGPHSAALAIKLKVFIAEQMEVKSSAPAISAEPDKNLSSIVLMGKDLQTLPASPASLLEALRLIACPSCRPEEVALYVNGFRYDSSGKSSRLPPKEAIEMIRIGANPFSPEYQEPGQGRIEIVTKPGSDGFHSDVSVRYNDESLNARNAMASERAPLQVRDFSGYAMGPIIHNRLDFLAYAGRWQQNENSIVNATAINPLTFQPQVISTTVVTPSRISNVTLHTNYQATAKHSLGVEYARTTDNAFNQGLQSGLDLPERAFRRSSSEDAFRFSFTSLLNERTVNESRFELTRRTYGMQAASAAPAVLVLDAFNAGGNSPSLFSSNQSRGLQLVDNFTRTINRHTLKLGLRAEALGLTNTNRANFNGTFTFGADVNRDAAGNPLAGAGGEPALVTPLENYRRTLMGLPGYGPSQFSIVRGTPAIRLSQWQAGWFIQDDWRVSPRLTLSYGLRHDFQTHLGDKLNFAPRVGVAWVADKQSKSTVRAGAGLFYSAIFSDLTLTTTRLDGAHQQELRIQRPNFFAAIPTTFTQADVALPTIYRKAPDLRAPYSLLTKVSYERQLPWKMYGTVGYTWQRGIDLLRTRNLSSDPASDGVILQYEATGKSSRHELLFALRGQIGKRLSLFSNYALSVTRSNTDGPETAAASRYDLASEYGYSSLDRRHSFYFGGTLSLPWAISLNPFVTLTTGQPFNITTGSDNNGDTLFTDRPGFATIGSAGAIASRFGVFTPNPLAGAPLVPRNFARAPGQAIVNLNFTKTFRLGWPWAAHAATAGAQQGGERRIYSMVFEANVENLLNHANFTGYNGVLTSPLFGRPNRALNGRRVEFALRFTF